MKHGKRSRDDGSCPYSWLNEWLCEYVDGTMDPSLRRVFEKYVEANPDLKEHVERLRHTRQLLCHCSQAAQQEAPDEVRSRVQEQVECDLLRTPHSLQEAMRERPVMAFASSFVVALVVGLFAGATLFGPESVPSRAVQADVNALRFERPPQERQPTLHIPQHTPITGPNAASSAAFQTLIDRSMGAPYRVDSTAQLRSWNTSVRP